MFYLYLFVCFVSICIHANFLLYDDLITIHILLHVKFFPNGITAIHVIGFLLPISQLQGINRSSILCTGIIQSLLISKSSSDYNSTLQILSIVIDLKVESHLMVWS